MIYEFHYKCFTNQNNLLLNVNLTLTRSNQAVLQSDVKFFAESLAEYKRQHEETTQIVENMSVGMLLCDASKLKTKMLPSPQKCLEVPDSYHLNFSLCTHSFTNIMRIPFYIELVALLCWGVYHCIHPCTEYL